MKCVLLASAAWAAISSAALAGTGTITTKDAGGVTRTFDVITDGTGNFNPTAVICDQSAAATCASVGTAGSPSTNALTVQGVTLGHGTAANAMRVELPTDGTGLVNAAQSGTWNITTVTTLSTLTGGGVASGSADSGNPVKIGGKFNAAPVTLTDGNRGDLQLTSAGLIRAMPGANWLAQTTWTTATSLNTNLVLACGENPPALNVDLLGSGTITTGAISFQYANDATDCSGTTGTWTNLPVSQTLNQFTLANLTNPFTLVSSDQPFLILTNGVRAIRARLTTAITGAGGQVVITPTVGSINPAIAALLNPLSAGSAIIGKVGIDQTTPGTTNAVQPIAGATGGSSTTGNIVANNTTAVVVKASAGTLYGAQLFGIGSAPAYLKIYNATSATCGSGTPVKRLPIPAASTAANGAGSNVTFGPDGVNFGTGITYCVTTGITDADTTAPAASTFLVNLDWQ